MIDSARALLLSQSYRYKIVASAAVRDANPGATEIVIETNLDEAAATTLANAIFNESSVKGRGFSFTIEDALLPDDFLVSPPRFTLAFERHPLAGNGTITYTVAAATVDDFTGLTTLTVRA